MGTKTSPGRPRTSDDEKIIKGTFKPSRAAPTLDIPDDPKYPRRPPELKGKARLYWQHHMRAFVDDGRITEHNISTFVRFCMLQKQLYDLYIDLDEKGWTDTQANGNRKMRNEAKAWLDLHAKLGALENEFGLTPAAELRMKAKTKDDGKKKKGPSLADFNQAAK